MDCVNHDISIKHAYKELWKLWDNEVIPEPSLVINLVEITRVLAFR